MKRLLFFCCILSLHFTLQGQDAWQVDTTFIKKNIDKYAPDFSVTTLKNDTFCLSDLRGKVVFLNFGFAQCMPCIAEIPLLKKLYKTFEREEFIILSISVLDSAVKMQKLEKLHNIPYSLVPISPTTTATSKLLSDNMLIANYLFYCKVMPINFIIDSKGVIRYANYGYLASKENEYSDKLSKLISILLSKK